MSDTSTTNAAHTHLYIQILDYRNGAPYTRWTGDCAVKIPIKYVCIYCGDVKP